MKRILALSFLLVSGAVADDLKLTDGTVYKDYKVVRLEADGLSIEYADGLARVPCEKLPAELQKKYGWKPEAVERYRQYKADVKTSKAAAARAAVPQKSRKVEKIGSPEPGEFGMKFVDVEAAIIDAGYRSKPHAMGDSAWLTGERKEDAREVSLTIHQRPGDPVAMIDRCASRVEVTVSITDARLSTATLAAPVGEMFRMFGGDGKALEKWIGEQAQPGQGLQRYECELSGCYVFMASNHGVLLMVEFVRQKD